MGKMLGEYELKMRRTPPWPGHGEQAKLVDLGGVKDTDEYQRAKEARLEKMEDGDD